MKNSSMDQHIKDCYKIIDKYKNLNSFPISVIGIADELEIKVYQTTDLDKGVSGLICKEDDKFIIYINEENPARRKLFTIAHELGHFVNHFDILNNGNPFITYIKTGLGANNCVMARADSSICSEEQRGYETEANRFAAELLMPYEEFIKITSKYDEIQDVADYFGVSVQAASIRSEQLGVLFI